MPRIAIAFLASAIALQPLPPSLRQTTRRTAVTSEDAIGITVVDVEAMREASTFPIAPDDLIRRCQEVLVAGVGTEDPSMLAPSMEFAGPVVGPISRDQYLKTVEPAVKSINEAFPDLQPQYYDFRVDPFEPNRVWYTSRSVGRMTGDLNLAGTLRANNKEMLQPPQTASIMFDEQGRVLEVTAGYVMDRRQGNTGGLGAVYAVLTHCGLALPFPEGQPWSPSPPFKLFLEATQFVDNISGGILGKPPPPENAYWRRPTSEINSKARNPYLVLPRYKDL